MVPIAELWMTPIWKVRMMLIADVQMLPNADDKNCKCSKIPYCGNLNVTYCRCSNDKLCPYLNPILKWQTVQELAIFEFKYKYDIRIVTKLGNKYPFTNINFPSSKSAYVPIPKYKFT